MFRKIVCNHFSTDFAACTEVVEFKDVAPLGDGDVLLAPQYLGINASDINYTAGFYNPKSKLPFDVGLECIGKVLAIGSKVTHVQPGDRAGAFGVGTFASLYRSPAGVVVKLPSNTANPAFEGPESMHLIISGLTALLALHKVGELPTTPTQPPTRVLVTAAAGATGMMAVQIAKAAGAFVVGTTSSASKAEAVRAAGADAVVITSQESIPDVVKRAVPGRKIDIVYESVGGKLFSDAFECLAHRGRLIVIGSVSGYVDGSCFAENELAGWPMRLLAKSASVRGFFLGHFVTSKPGAMQKAMGMLSSLVEQGKVRPRADLEPTRGLEGIVKAVTRLHTGSTVGKVVVELPSMDENGYSDGDPTCENTAICSMSSW